ncbi:DUF2382 domain-containing protein [Labedella populi]|uniref:DUF2382 domain-containing protein n=1 Tax=Labedella populi TaxID=2498850 RepID=A0A3S4A6M4_9MICO|nr:PRC-barrel domain-containing protein [Labedella populi]RWZ61564.1 DUF2382 domain-containing protein [Labedella populi]
MIDPRNTASLIGADVLDPDGETIGTVGQVYLDPDTDRPLWATVRTGLFGNKESFVPLEGASYSEDRLHVEHSKDAVKHAPKIDADGALTHEEEDNLYAHYRPQNDDHDGDGQDDGHHRGLADRLGFGKKDHDDDHDAHDHDGRDHARDDDREHELGSDRPHNDDDRPGRHAAGETPAAGTDGVETGRMRLRKYTVTEERTVTVPVTREEVRLEPETGAASDATDSDHDRRR